MLGNVSVKNQGDKLSLSINDYLSYELSHWNYDTFITNKDPDWRWELFIKFNMNTSGEINDLEVFGESFTKQK
jgi:hypothetical protein